MEKRIEVKELTADLITDRYLSWFNNESVVEFSGGGKKNLTKQKVLDYIKKGIDTGRYYMWAIFIKEKNLHIGNIKVGEIDLKNNVSALGTIIGDVDYWGKGLATEAILVAQKLAFDKYNFRKLSDTILAGNIGSLKAYKKAGWVEEGLLKDHIKIGDKLYDQIIVSKFNPKIYLQS